ncbi:hypothetical protein NDU88_000329 [Pleurodeles waltl]|uniref:Uncharacterized protein n=1 Tax=Pleurodeles waltl TaxID=8319 RepID=A0AAV7PZW8_PLEWA|nr:hypothetical protein NDU88_000329 [Pleurodeles waltl]
MPPCDPRLCFSSYSPPGMATAFCATGTGQQCLVAEDPSSVSRDEDRTGIQAGSRTPVPQNPMSYLLTQPRDVQCVTIMHKRPVTWADTWSARDMWANTWIACDMCADTWSACDMWADTWSACDMWADTLSARDM